MRVDEAVEEVALYHRGLELRWIVPRAVSHPTFPQAHPHHPQTETYSKTPNPILFQKSNKWTPSSFLFIHSLHITSHTKHTHTNKHNHRPNLRVSIQKGLIEFGTRKLGVRLGVELRGRASGSGCRNFL